MSPQPKTKGKPGNGSPASSHFLYPRPPLGDFTKVDAIQKQNPPTEAGGFAAAYFGASPVASALDPRLERDPSADRFHTNMPSPSAWSKPDISTLQRIGHFYFASSAKEIAFLCGVSVGTITHLAVKWRKSGGAEGIPAIKIGKLWRFRKAEVLDWLSDPHPPYRAAVESGDNPVRTNSSAKEPWDDDYGRWADDGGNSLD